MPTGGRGGSARLVGQQLTIRLCCSTRYRGKHIAHELRTARHQRLEFVVLQDEHPTIVRRAGGRGVPLPGEQGDLTEEVALGELSNSPRAPIGFSCRQLHLARGNDDHRLGRLALTTQDVVLTQMLFVHAVSELVEIFRGQLCEEVDRSQQVRDAHT